MTIEDVRIGDRVERENPHEFGVVIDVDFWLVRIRWDRETSLELKADGFVGWKVLGACAKTGSP